MEAARKLEEEIVNQLLQIVYGDKYLSPLKKKRINDLWDICYATIWPKENFSKTEIETFKVLIADHFIGSENADEKFAELIERVVLAKRYINRRQGRYISKPIDWLNIHFKTGLQGTEKWYKQVTDQRKTVPHYNEGIKLLSEALLSFSKHQKTNEIEQYREEFIKQKQHDLLFYYTNAIMHLLFI